jgi:hypothetical protein
LPLSTDEKSSRSFAMFFIITFFLTINGALWADTSFHFIRLKSQTKSSLPIDHREAMTSLYSADVTKSLKSNAKAASSNFPDILQVLKDYLGPRFQEWSQFEIDRLTQFNRQFNLGETNFSGLSWQKPMGSFDLNIDRQVTPDTVMPGRWLVSDELKIKVQATTLLDQLNDSELLDMTEKEIQAFAGLTFERTYTTHHFASSYLNGLKSDFTRLFLPFLNFGPEAAWRMSEGMIQKRHDKWSLNVQGAVKTPLGQGFSLGGGLSLARTHESTLSLVHLEPKSTEDDIFEFNVTVANNTDFGAHINLQQDFLKALNLTLFAGSLEFNRAASQNFALRFKQPHQNMIYSAPHLIKEWKQLFTTYSPKITYLEPFVLRMDESTTEGSKKQWQFLVFHSLKKTKLEHVRIIKDNDVKVFFKSYAESIKTLKSLKQEIFNSELLKKFKLGNSDKAPTVMTRQLEIEYEATTAQSFDPKKMSIQEPQEFFMRVGFQFQTSQKSFTEQKKRVKAALLKFLERFTNLPAEVKTGFQEGNLGGTTQIQASLDFNHQALDYFHALSYEKRLDLYLDLCRIKKKEAWKKLPPYQVKREGLLAFKAKCVSDLLSWQKAYLDHYQEFKRYDLFYLKKITQKILKKAKNINVFKDFFGDHIYLMGQIKSQTASGIPYENYFQGGQYLGQGVIEGFKKL